MAFKKKVIDTDDIVDEEDFTWGDDKGIDIKKIIFAHINRISEFIFKGGGDGEYNESSKGIQKPKADKRETIIRAIEFLDALLCPEYDKEMKDFVEENQKKIDEQQKILLNISLDKEASEIAMRTDRHNYKQALDYWKGYLTKQKYGFYDKDSGEYEFFIAMKSQLLMELFKQMNLFLKRTDYMETPAYTE